MYYYIINAACAIKCKIIPFKNQVTKLGEEPRRPCPPIDITSQLDLGQGAQQGCVVWRDRGKV